MSVNFAIRSSYNFDVYPAALLGTNFIGVTVLAIMDYQTANKEIDTQALHAQVYPFLPPGTPNDPAAYDYIKIKTSSGHTTILGIAWINAVTIELVQSSTITAVISNCTAADVNRIRNALIQNGYSSIAITIK